jgi:hypothetical protein
MGGAFSISSSNISSLPSYIVNSDIPNLHCEKFEITRSLFKGSGLPRFLTGEPEDHSRAEEMI